MKPRRLTDDEIKGIVAKLKQKDETFFLGRGKGHSSVEIHYHDGAPRKIKVTDEDVIDLEEGR